MKWRLYRLVMKLSHRFDWHYAPVGGPDNDVAWCQWCGLRYKVIDMSKGPYPINVRVSVVGKCDTKGNISFREKEKL